MGFKLDYFFSVFLIILPYLPKTLLIAFLAFIISLTIALIIAIISKYKIKFLYSICRFYVSFFRSTPAITQIFFLYYGLAQVFDPIKNMSAFWAIVIVLALNQSSYMSETIRGAFNSVPKGQYEACLSIGMTRWESMKRVIIPQAIWVAVPGLSNSFISLIKGTSLGFTIGVIEMMSMAKIEGSSSYRYMEAYMAILIIYWIMVSIFVLIQKQIENKSKEMY